MRQRELPLAVVRCCRAYVVSMLHPVPACPECGLTPFYERDVDMTVTFPED